MQSIDDTNIWQSILTRPESRSSVSKAYVTQSLHNTKHITKHTYKTRKQITNKQSIHDTNIITKHTYKMQKQVTSEQSIHDTKHITKHTYKTQKQAVMNMYVTYSLVAYMTHYLLILLYSISIFLSLVSITVS